MKRPDAREVERTWRPDRELAELQLYLGDDFDHDRLTHHVLEVEREEAAAVDERDFYRTSTAYLYDLTVFAMGPTKVPYHALLRDLFEPGAHLVDYGCGIGSDGLRLLEAGYRVTFADFANPSTDYLRWRLAHRGLTAEVLDVEAGIGSGYDGVFCFDVIEHVAEPAAFLGMLEAIAPTVVVNLLEPAPGDTHLHRLLDVDQLVRHMRRHRLRHHAVHHGRSHLVAYDVVAAPRRVPRPNRSWLRRRARP
jgi:hypothetical protein